MKRCGVTQGFQREDNLNEERPQDADASEALTAETTCSEATVSEEKGKNSIKFLSVRSTLGQ